MSFDATIRGTEGVDLLIQPTPSFDSNLVRALGGNDTIREGSGADQVYGGSGHDTVYGGVNSDKIFGDADNDALFGGAGGDRLYGGSGDDIIEGGDGNDVLYGDVTGDRNQGGVGSDTFVFDNFDGRDQVFDFVSGVDKVVLTHESGPSIPPVLEIAYGASGNTIVTWGATTIIFYDELLTLSDFTID